MMGYAIFNECPVLKRLWHLGYRSGVFIVNFTVAYMRYTKTSHCFKKERS